MAKLRPESVIAICSIVVALVALFVAVWQTMETRSHNRKSVVPKLNIDRDFGDRPFVSINNSGLGPAVIKSIMVSYEDTKYVIDSPNTWKELNRRLGINRLPIAASVIHEDSYLVAGKSKNLIAMRIDDTQKKFRSAMRKITITVYYESVYGDEFMEHLGCNNC